MFNKFCASNACIWLVALALMAFIFVSCGSDDNNGPDDNPSSGSTVLPPKADDPKVVVTFTREDTLTIAYEGDYDMVNIRFGASVVILNSDAEQVFDKALINLNSAKVKENAGEPGFSINESFSVSNVACGGPIEVCYYLYANKNDNPVERGCKTIVKDKNSEYGSCKPSSSSTASSSSVTPPKTFGAVQEMKLNASGVDLGTGKIVFYNREIIAQNGAQITDCFEDDGICKTISTTKVANPSTTADFTPRNRESDWEDSYAYTPNRYYIVKTSGTGWGSGWFLITSATDVGPAELDLKVWTVN